MSAIGSAIDAIFGDSNVAKDALWRTGGNGDGVPCRVTIATPDEIASFGRSRAIVASATLDVRKSEISAPAIEDTVEIPELSLTYAIIAEPRIDTEGLVWSCEAAKTG